MSAPILSPTDDRKYKYITLANKIKCILISDEAADKSAAAVSVNVGAISDPEGRFGLAHFLEHMLFLGTEKYPVQNDYSSYISAHGGMRNAFTALQETDYFFDIAPASLEGALDRFSQFFTAPLFTEECTDKEINAVDSENKKNLLQDAWRRYQLFRSSSKKNHPFIKFGTGNKETLSHPTIREDLLTFYKKYYSANIMKLCIYGKEDLATLEKWANNFFSDVKNYDVAMEVLKENPFEPESMKTFWKVVSIEDQDFIDIIWITESIRAHYRNNPGHYISDLVGHEGENSILSYLIDEGLALSLSAGYSSTGEMFGEFKVRIKLTKKGLAEYRYVCRIVFEYLRMLKDHGVSKEHFQELKTVLKMRFENKDKEKAVGYVQTIVGRMQIYPIEDIVQLPYLMEEFDPDFLKYLINNFTVDNMRIYLSSKSLEKDCSQTEQWYGTKYSVEPISNEILEGFIKPNVGPSKSGKILDLPPLNRYIPKNFDLLPAPEKPSKYPVKIFSDESLDIYYKQDVTFKRPKGSIQIFIMCNDCGFGQSFESYLQLRIWLKLLRESMKEFTYEAQMASVALSIGQNIGGIDIWIDGFNDSLIPVCQALFKNIRNFDPRGKESRFNDMRNETIDAHKNELKSPPYQRAGSIMNVVMEKGGSLYLPEQGIEYLEKVKYEDFLDFSSEFLKNVRFESIICGNISKQTAEDLSRLAKENVFALRKNSAVLPRDLIPEIRVCNIPIGSAWFYETHAYSTESGEKEKNSSILSMFQLEKETPQTMVLLDVLANYMKDPCFDTLRTNEQLGYIVSGYKGDHRNILVYKIVVQSAVKSPQFISERILAFLDKMREKIKTVSDETFAKFVESSRVRAAEKDLSIAQETARYAGVIAKHTYQFDRREVFLEELKKIKKEDMINLFEDIFFKSRKLLEVHIIANEHSTENAAIKAMRLSEEDIMEVISPEWFKRRLPLYPDYYSMM